MTKICCALGVLLLTVAGCGGGSGGGSVVTGRIVKGGSPLKVEGIDIGVGRIEVRFIPTFQGASEETALASPDGSFKLVGAGNGIPPGTYKIAVLALQVPTDPKAGTAEVDILKGAFSPKKTPIQREVTGGSCDLGTIDLDNPGG